MTNSEIAELYMRVGLGGVWWRDDDNRIHRVRTVQMEGSAAAVLMDGQTTTLDSAEVSDFVTLLPAVLPGT